MFTRNFKQTSFEKVFRLIKAITYVFRGIHTPCPLMSMPVDKVKLTQYNKQINKRCAIANLVCCNKGT